MFNRRIRKIVNKLRISKIKCNVMTESITYKKKTDKLIKYKQLRNRMIYFLMLFPILTTISSVLLCYIHIDLYPITFNYKKYTIGEKVTLLNNMEGYCISNCGENSRKITILNLDVLDINNDSIIDEKDMISYDVDNTIAYDSEIQGNIASLLKEKEDRLAEIEEYRLMTSEEYVTIRNKMNFGYDWDDGNWLANEKIGSWWLSSSKFSNILVVTKRGSYKLSKPSEKNYVRPIFITYKENIK